MRSSSQQVEVMLRRQSALDAWKWAPETPTIALERTYVKNRIFLHRCRDEIRAGEMGEAALELCSLYTKPIFGPDILRHNRIQSLRTLKGTSVTVTAPHVKSNRDLVQEQDVRIVAARINADHFRNETSISGPE
eukprot:CAMPEP_0184681188 /NCGR_PEP_ID=MMETSP0312-20130426/4139_1 /TAXON_ID=31354 /ORGANISM="Compsopogon coeruleus, Strain SAG 36.94" /LENGTH=133 /DNA_ID=CAMNT_0027131853 /DNA_START=852 /DNA_END=1254 /DNA_ORIENTATION=+